MRRSGPFTSVVLALLFLAAGGLKSQEQRQPPAPVLLMSMTELKSGNHGQYFVTASINGRDVHVVVDTGASAVALSYEDADRIGLKPRNLTYDVPVTTANGVGMAARVTLREVEIDTVRVDNVQGLVLQEGAINITLLGMSFLGKLRSFQVENGRLMLKN
jgi:aspartyl protease family protein